MLLPVLASLVGFLFAQTVLTAGFAQTSRGNPAGALERGSCGGRPPGSPIDPKKFQQSLRPLQDRLRSAPEDPGLHHQLGLLYESQNQFMEAIGQYREAVHLDSSSEKFTLALASIFFHCWHNQQAIEVLQGFLRTRPDSLAAIRLLCRVHVREGKYDRALRLAKEYVRLDRGDSYGHYLLGLGHNGLGEFEDARNGFERSVELNPSFADAYVKLGLLYSGDSTTFPQAVANLRKAVELGLTRPDVRKDLGFVLLKLGQYQEAIAELELALKESPDYIEPYYLLADAYRKLGMKEKVASAMERFQALRSAAKRVESEVERYYWEGMDSLAEGQPERAYASFLKVLRISPDMHPALYRLAQIDSMRGDVQRAQKRIRQAIQLYPRDPEYHFLLANSLAQSDPEGAVDAVRTAIDLNPAVADFHNLLANLLSAGGNYNDAILAYRRAIEIDADDPVPHLNLSTALRNVGSVDESKKEKSIYLRLITPRSPD